jgi:hypothetical protein
MTSVDASRLIIALMTGATPARALAQFEVFRCLRLVGDAPLDAALKRRLLARPSHTIEDVLVLLLEAVISDPQAFSTDSGEPGIVGFVLQVNETAQSALVMIGRDKFNFVNMSGPARSRTSDAGHGIQTTRSITYLELEIIAQSLDGQPKKARAIVSQDAGGAADAK